MTPAKPVFHLFTVKSSVSSSAFFNQPHSIGLVVDPVRLQEKWFIGPDSVELQHRQILQQA
jgi:hypothetical protein